MDEEERKANQAFFLACEYGIFVATSAFALGLDIPDICAVV
jgi:superfamily II DNA helicase RecQ